jgi:hypothetical protein
MSHLLIRILISLSARAALSFQMVVIAFINNIIVNSVEVLNKEKRILPHIYGLN